MRTLLLGVALLAALPLSSHAQQIRARVVDSVQRTPLAAVRITVTDSVGAEHAGAQTGSDGFFAIHRLTPGAYTLVAERDGYFRLRRSLIVSDAAAITLPAILLQSQALTLDTVRAEARAERETRPGQREEISAEAVLAGARLAELEKVNASPAAVYRELGLRVTEGTTPAGRVFCVRTRRGPTSMRGGGGAGGCEPVALIVDGMLVTDQTLILRSLKLDAWESIEYLTSVEAAQRFGLHGSSSGGAIVLWTRGSGPHRSPSRNGGSDLH